MSINKAKNQKPRGFRMLDCYIKQTLVWVIPGKGQGRGHWIGHVKVQTCVKFRENDKLRSRKWIESDTPFSKPFRIQWINQQGVFLLVDDCFVHLTGSGHLKR